MANLKDILQENNNKIATVVKEYIDQHTPDSGIGEGSITTNKLQNGAVTKDKLASDIFEDFGTNDCSISMKGGTINLDASKATVNGIKILTEDDLSFDENSNITLNTSWDNIADGPYNITDIDPEDALLTNNNYEQFIPQQSSTWETLEGVPNNLKAIKLTDTVLTNSNYKNHIDNISSETSNQVINTQEDWDRLLEKLEDSKFSTHSILLNCDILISADEIKTINFLNTETLIIDSNQDVRPTITLNNVILIANQTEFNNINFYLDRSTIEINSISYGLITFKTKNNAIKANKLLKCEFELEDKNDNSQYAISLITKEKLETTEELNNLIAEKKVVVDKQTDTFTLSIKQKKIALLKMLKKSFELNNSTWIYDDNYKYFSFKYTVVSDITGKDIIRTSFSSKVVETMDIYIATNLTTILADTSTLKLTPIADEVPVFLPKLSDITELNTNTEGLELIENSTGITNFTYNENSYSKFLMELTDEQFLYYFSKLPYKNLINLNNDNSFSAGYDNYNFKNNSIILGRKNINLGERSVIIGSGIVNKGQDSFIFCPQTSSSETRYSVYNVDFSDKAVFISDIVLYSNRCEMDENKLIRSSQYKTLDSACISLTLGEDKKFPTYSTPIDNYGKFGIIYSPTTIAIYGKMLFPTSFQQTTKWLLLNLTSLEISKGPKNDYIHYYYNGTKLKKLKESQTGNISITKDNIDNENLLDYYVLPLSNIPQGNSLVVDGKSYIYSSTLALEVKRFLSLE